MHPIRSFATAAAIAAVSLLLVPCEAHAQDAGSRAEEVARAQQEKARTLSTYKAPWIERTLIDIENAGGFSVRRGAFVTFGDIKRGSGIALGPAYGQTLASGAVVEAKTVYSINNYKLAQVSMFSPAVADGRLTWNTRVRWQDAPTVRLYGLGSGSSDLRTEYAETKTEVSGHAAFRPVHLVRFGGGASLERFTTGVAHDADPSRAFLFDGVPGVGADPTYLHGYGSAAIDSRDGDGYSRRGTLLRATLHGYGQQNDGPYSFQRVDGDAEQYVPILRGNWVLYLGLHASTTSAGAGHTIPFFLMPDIGGHDLRGFSNYRFRDRHSLLVTAEYRWYAQEYLDGAIFYDAGKAVSDRNDLDFTDLKRSIGAGIRLHGARSTILRAEIAHGREGLRFILAFSPVGGD
jgi:hypothetical protein